MVRLIIRFAGTVNGKAYSLRASPGRFHLELSEVYENFRRRPGTLVNVRKRRHWAAARRQTPFGALIERKAMRLGLRISVGPEDERRRPGLAWRVAMS